MDPYDSDSSDRGGKVGGEVANNDEHAYIDVHFLFN
jgi:hypothetical protein